jgi:hypothetical protein
MKPSALAAFLAVGLVIFPQPSQGQRIASPAFALFRPAPTPPPARPASFIHRAPDYRWEGIAIGGIAGGLLFGIAVHRFCKDGDTGGPSCISPTVFGAVLGGAAGGLFGCFVGMFIPKSHSASTH